MMLDLIFEEIAIALSKRQVGLSASSIAKLTQKKIDKLRLRITHRIDKHYCIYLSDYSVNPGAIINWQNMIFNFKSCCNAALNSMQLQC